jgi:exopolysaccharide production protein ExoQ
MTANRSNNRPLAEVDSFVYFARGPWSGSQSTLLMPGIVGFYFAFRAIFVLIAVRLFLLDPRAGVAANLVSNFLLLLLVAFQMFGNSAENATWLLNLRPFRWVLAFLCLSGSSLLWTIAESRTAASVYWCAMAADLAMVVLLLRSVPVLQLAAGLIKGYVWGACAVAFAAWLLPLQSDMRLGDEGLLGPNQIGFVCAFALFLAQFPIRSKERFWIAPSLFLGITLLRTLSKTSIIALLAGQAFILLRDRTLSVRAKLLMVGAAICILAAFSGLLESYYTIYTNAGDQAETLTGRLGIWVYFLENSLEQPWIGHGFHSVWKVVPLFSEDFEARHAHNELLQQFYAYGVAGVVSFFGLYGSLWRQIRSLAPGAIRTLAGGLLLFILVRGLADTEPFDLSLPLWAITLLSAFLFRPSTSTQPHSLAIPAPQPAPLRSLSARRTAL